MSDPRADVNCIHLCPARVDSPKWHCEIGSDEGECHRVDHPEQGCRLQEKLRHKS